MKKHCPVCKEEREFNHISRDDFENVYECDTCSFQDKKKTGKGLAAAFLPGLIGGGLIGAALELLESHHHDS